MHLEKSHLGLYWFSHLALRIRRVGRRSRPGWDGLELNSDLGARLKDGKAFPYEMHSNHCLLFARFVAVARAESREPRAESREQRIARRSEFQWDLSGWSVGLVIFAFYYYYNAPSWQVFLLYYIHTYVGELKSYQLCARLMCWVIK